MNKTCGTCGLEKSHALDCAMLVEVSRLAGTAVNWLHALAPKAGPERHREVRQLADDLFDQLKALKD